MNSSNMSFDGMKNILYKIVIVYSFVYILDSTHNTSSIEDDIIEDSFMEMSDEGPTAINGK